MKIYAVLFATPWEKFFVETPEGSIQAHSSDTFAGFIPLYFSREAAESAFPGQQIQELDVEEGWHPRFPVVSGEVSESGSVGE